MNHSEAGAYAPRSFASFIDTLPGEPSIGVFNYFTYYNGSGNASRQFPIRLKRFIKHVAHDLNRDALLPQIFLAHRVE